MGLVENRRRFRGKSLASALLGTSFLFAVSSISAPAFADAHLEAENASLKSEVEDLKQEVQILKGMVLKQNERIEAAGQAGPPEKMVKSGKKQIELEVSGQVNRMLLYADDGDQARVFHADNDQSSTRVRFKGKGKLNDDLSVGTTVEVQFESNSTADVTIDQNKSVIGSNSFTERKLELFFKSKTLGKLSLGQGSSASDGAVEEDLSGTDVITSAGYAGTGESLEFVLSGALARAGTGVTVGDVFDNLDGLSRDDRLRYDSPTFAGFQLSTSWVDGDEWDAALRYGREFNGFEVVFAAAYWDAQSTDDKVGYGGSASVLAPFGTSLTGAYSTEDVDFVQAPNAQADTDPSFWYVKLGQQFDATSLGGTAISIAYSETEEVNGDPRNEGTYYDLAITQEIDEIATELYAVLGVYEADLVNGAGASLDTEDIFIGGAGARIKF